MTLRVPAVFIHGFIGSFELTDPDFDYLAPDLLGYGRYANVPPEEISLYGQVEHIRGLIDDTFGHTGVDVVGHSVGGAIGMLLAHTYPARVRRVVNVEGNFTLNDAFWSASVGHMTPDEADAMLRGLRSDPLGWLHSSVPGSTDIQLATGWLEHQPASTLRAMGKSVVDVTGDRDYLRAVEAVFGSHPVCLLSGERSRPTWNVPAWALQHCARDVVLAGCGHLMMVEDPAAFNEAIKNFLDG